MSAPRRTPGTVGGPEGAAGDDDFARAYSEGYGEGLREAFREMLQHASRGHTASELRILIESRLARVKEDIELKRHSVLSPPRRPSWGSMLRPPAPSVAPDPPLGPASVGRGEAWLFREEGGRSGAEFAAASASGFPRVLAISLRTPTFPGVLPERVTVVPVSAGGAPGSVVHPTDLSGRIRSAAEADGGAFVYLDAFDTLTTEVGIETMLKFVAWLVGEMHTTGSSAVVAVDPATLDERSMALLQRTFDRVR